MPTTTSHFQTSTPPRPDLRGFERSIQPLQVVVKGLRDLLGVRLVAYIAGVKETRAVHEWADGTREVRSLATEQRLRLAYRIAVMLAERDTNEVVQAWFQGLNPQLDEIAPARLLREGEIETDGPRVLDAARAFTAVG